MVIPRENRYVRLYIQVTEIGEDGRAVGTLSIPYCSLLTYFQIDRFKITPQNLLDAASKILSPYKLTYKHCHWWTAYRIGQRVGSKFSAYNRVFLAGDAVHTHSPKAGQGMNISMHDSKFPSCYFITKLYSSISSSAYNLGWKLASVINGKAERKLLQTYEVERRQIARELIAFDQKFSRLFSSRPLSDTTDADGVDPETFKEVFEKGNLFSSGCAVDYVTNLIVAKSEDDKHRSGGHHFQTDADMTDPSSLPSVYGKQYLAKNILIGMRIPSHKVLNQSDARPWHLQELLPSNGTWRVLVFAGNIAVSQQMSRYEAFGEALSDPTSFYHTYTTSSDSTFELLTIHSSPRNSIELQSLPSIFHPFSEEYGWDYSKVYVDDVSYHEGHGMAYENYGIDPQRGCVVVVRPDQYVSWIGDLEDVVDMNTFFGSFMRSQSAKVFDLKAQT